MKTIINSLLTILCLTISFCVSAHNTLPLAPSYSAIESTVECAPQNESVFFLDPQNDIVYADLIAVQSDATMLSVLGNDEVLMEIDLSTAGPQAIIEVPFSWHAAGIYSFELNTTCNCQFTQTTQWENGELRFVHNQ